MDNIIVCEYCGTSQVINQRATFDCEKCGAPLRIKFADDKTVNTANRRTLLDALPWTFSPPSFSTTQVAETYEVEGVDVSQYQGEMNWNRAFQVVQAAYFRSTMGTSGIDAQYARNLDIVGALGTPFGNYHACKPDKDALKSARHFAAHCHGDMPPCADVELTGGLGKSALESWVLKFLLELEQLTGKKAIIYTSAYFWNTFLPRTDWAKDYLLFAAHWTTAASPIIPWDWGAIKNPVPWTLWQYSADGNNMGASLGAQSRDIDRWRYNGTRAQFNEQFGVDIPAPPPPPTPEESIIITGLGSTARLNMRDRIWGNVVGQTWNGKVFPLEGQAQDATGQTWYRIGKGIWVSGAYAKKV